MAAGLLLGDFLDTPEPRMLLRRLMAQVSKKWLASECQVLVNAIRRWKRIDIRVHLNACIHSCSSRKIWQCSFNSCGSSRASRYGHGWPFTGVLAVVDLVVSSDSSSLLV